MATRPYHKEIDGLRAISVFVIILFHLDVSFVKGGFVMVDVFFVLSGYLITQIVASGLESGRFTFRDFFIRRSTRILPALIAAIALTLLGAVLVQQPASLEHTARESLAALFSVSNIFLWSEASYWAPSSKGFPLLHTWSLGVEEQFYLIYPFFLYGCYRLGGIRGIAISLFIVLIVGVTATEWTMKVDRAAAFFLTPLRFFEFAVGGLGGLMSARAAQKLTAVWLKNLLTVLGLFCILLSIMLFNPFYSLPGLASLLPTVGAVIVMLAGASPIARVVLSNRFMSWLGTTSYSIYLLHWPIIVFYRYHYGGHLTTFEKAGLFVATLVAGELLARAVERRFRLVGNGQTTATGIAARPIILGIIVSTIVVAISAATLIWSKGWPSRLPEEVLPLLEINPKMDMRRRISLYEKQCTPKGELFCGQRQEDGPNILLLGDSRVLDVYFALKTAYPDAAIRSSYAMGCPAVFSRAHSIAIFYRDCPDYNQARLQAALDAPSEDIIFLAQNVYDFNSEAVMETVKRLREAGKKVYVLGDFQLLAGRSAIEAQIETQRFKFDKGRMERLLVPVPFPLEGEYADSIRAIGAVYVSQKGLFYDGEYHLDDRNTGELLTYDGKHLSYFGAIKFGKYLQKHYQLQ
jgi:peptidoglycan/LPS O-acetylase OafA/YrhL